MSMVDPSGSRWLSLEEAYARRSEYPEEFRVRIVEMMRKERAHKADVGDRKYLSGKRRTAPAEGQTED